MKNPSESDREEPVNPYPKINWSTISLEDLAGFLSEELLKRGIKTYLVGGACVTIYSHNRYQSYDLDFVTYEDMRKVKKALIALGFQAKNRYFTHSECKWFVEFVSPPVAVGNQSITQFEQRVSRLGTICMLRPVDSVKDRLASYFHWNDRQGLEQAIDICLECAIDLNEVEEWSISEGHKEKYSSFISALSEKKKPD